MTKDEEIAKLKERLAVCCRERDDYRDLLKGIATNIRKAIDPIESKELSDG